MHKINFQKFLSNKTRTRHLAFINAVGLALLLCFYGATAVTAQSKRLNKKRGGKTIAKNVAPLKIDKTVKPNALTQTSLMPVAVVNAAETDFLSGEASVVVNPKQPTVVRLGLAQNAVSIVEFPALDGIYYIHEGNPKLVSVFQSPTRETDRSITIYPGEAFLAGREGGQTAPSATITLQMRSGLVLILELVPVSDLRKNAHRCVINYNRDEVVAARRTAGLAYNLGEDAKPAGGRNTRAASKLFSSSADEMVAETRNGTDVPVRLASLEISKGAIGRKTSDEKPSKKAKTGLELSRLVNKRLAECLKNPGKNLGSFSPATNNLSLAVSSVSEIDAEQRLVVVAVRNEGAANLRLVPGTPELQVGIIDEKGNALQTERLERSYVETTSLEGLIPPGSTVYYALVYNAPVMGASQRLRLLVAHREAADAPTTVPLPSVNAKKE